MHRGARALTLFPLSRPGVNIHPERLGHRRTAVITGGDAAEIASEVVWTTRGRLSDPLDVKVFRVTLNNRLRKRCPRKNKRIHKDNQ